MGSSDALLNKRAHIQAAVDQYAKHWKKQELWKALDDPKKPWHKTRVQLVCANMEGPEILDIASATGEMTVKIQKAVKPSKIIAYEGSAEIIAKGRELHPELTFVHGLVEEMPFEDNSFDFVHAGEILEHVTDPDSFVRRVAGIVRKGAVITTPSDVVMDPGHISLWTARGLRDLCLRYFTEVQVLDGGRTHVAVCRKPHNLGADAIDARVLWVTDIPAKAKGDWAQTVYTTKSLAAGGLQTTVVHLRNRSDPQFPNPQDTPKLRYLMVDSPIAEAVRLWKSGKFTHVVTRGPLVYLQLSEVVPTDRLIPFIYGGYFAEEQAVRKVWALAPRVIVQGDGQLQHVRDLRLDERKAVSIPIAVDYDILSRLPVERVQSPWLVGYLGSLSEYQCVDLAIDAVSLLRKSIDASLLVGGNEIPTLHTLPKAAANLRSKLQSTPWLKHVATVPMDGIGPFMQRIHCLLTLSYPGRDSVRVYRTMFIKTKVAEAMSAGVPVVTEPSWGNRYLLGDDYPYFATSIDDAVTKMLTLYGNEEERRSVGRYVRTRAEAFSLKNVGKKYAALLRR